MATQKSSTELRPRSPESARPARPTTLEGRPMRADARRNRELLVAAAREVFSAQGAGASMEAIAKQAGVGVGTLYRHFPNRLDLVEAVYETDVEELWERPNEWSRSSSRGPPSKRSSRPSCATPRRSRRCWPSSTRPSRRTPTCGRGHASASTPRSTSSSTGPRRPAPCEETSTGSDVVQLVGPICTNTGIEPSQAARLLGMVLDGLRADAARTALA